MRLLNKIINDIKLAYLLWCRSQIIDDISDIKDVLDILNPTALARAKSDMRELYEDLSRVEAAIARLS